MWSNHRNYLCVWSLEPKHKTETIQWGTKLLDDGTAENVTVNYWISRDDSSPSQSVCYLETVKKSDKFHAKYQRFVLQKKNLSLSWSLSTPENQVHEIVLFETQHILSLHLQRCNNALFFKINTKKIAKMSSYCLLFSLPAFFSYD